MGGGSRIRWRKVAKLALGALGCLALLLGLPSLIRRPEPPPLEPDIGLAPVAAAREPQRFGLQPERRTHKGTEERARDRRRPATRERRPPRSPRTARRDQEPPSTRSPVSGDPAPAPFPVPPSGAAPPPPTQAPPPAVASEFGFER